MFRLLFRLTLKTQLILPWRGFVIPANCIRAGEFKQTPSSPGTFVKRPRRFSSSCAKVSPRSVLKRVCFSTSTGARARGLIANDANSAPGLARVSMRVHRVYVGLAGFVFLESMKVWSTLDSNFRSATHYSPPPVQRKKHKCILKVN